MHIPGQAASLQEKRLKPIRVGRGRLGLADILALHRRHAAEEALARNIGDGYLLATNPVFRNVRAEFLRSGYRFTRENVGNSFAFPLMSLERMLAARAVPYHDNVEWLEALEARTPGRFDLEDVRKLGLSYNYLFHEAAHCVAHSVFHGAGALPVACRDRVALVDEMLGEAFANTVEALSWAFVAGEEGAYFLAANTHFVLPIEGVSAILRATRELGFHATITALVHSFLYANFRYVRLDAHDRGRVASLAGISESAATLDDLTSIACWLSEEFRGETTLLYLTHLGYSDDVLATLDLDPADVLSARQLERVTRLVRLLEPGLAGEFA